MTLLAEWKARAKKTEPDALVFSTWSGKPIAPNNILRRWVLPACEALGLERATWLTSGGRIPRGRTRKACPPRSWLS